MQRKVVWILGVLAVTLLAALPFLMGGAHGEHPAVVARAKVTAQVTVATTVTAGPPVELPTEAPTGVGEAWKFPAGSLIGSVPVGKLTVEEALDRVAVMLKQLDRTVEVVAGPHRFTLETREVLRLPQAGALVDEARKAASKQAVSLSLAPHVLQQPITERLNRELPNINTPMETLVISNVKALTQTYTFAVRPGRQLDVLTAATQISAAIQDPKATTVVVTPTLELPQRPRLSELARVLQEHAALWKGIVGFYTYDLKTGESIGYHSDTVFSGASVMKVPIMLFAYVRLGHLNDQQRDWLRLVINESKNIEANNLLAAAIGGTGTDDALVGAGKMSEMLRDLDLKHTYMLIPYESGDYLIQHSKLPGGGPPQEGAPPYTDADGYVRTTPSEMGRVFVMLAQCSEGRGRLLDKYGDKLSAAACSEMLQLLRTPHDQARMVAGVGSGVPVAHKGGWTEDFQGDVGVVDSPGGRYVAAIYIYRNGNDGYVSDADANPSPYIADFSHTIYSFFNPQILEPAPPAAK
ncbi:MAG: serine hydrolase [Herpetosiphon sp.]